MALDRLLIGSKQINLVLSKLRACIWTRSVLLDERRCNKVCRLCVTWQPLES